MLSGDGYCSSHRIAFDCMKTSDICWQWFRTTYARRSSAADPPRDQLTAENGFSDAIRFDGHQIVQQPRRSWATPSSASKHDSALNSPLSTAGIGHVLHTACSAAWDNAKTKNISCAWGRQGDVYYVVHAHDTALCTCSSSQKDVCILRPFCDHHLPPETTRIIFRP